MDISIASVGSNIGLAALGGAASVVTVAAAFFGPRIIRSVVSKQVGALLAKALDPKTDDPRKKELVVNLVRAAAQLAAYELPNRGHGPERKNAIKAHLEKLLPSKQSEVVAELLDEAIDTIDDQLEAVDDEPAAPKE